MASFEMGVQLLKNMLIKKKSYSAFLQMKAMPYTKPFRQKQRFTLARSGFPCYGTQHETFWRRSRLSLEKQKGLLMSIFLFAKAVVFSVCSIRILTRKKLQMHTRKLS